MRHIAIAFVFLSTASSALAQVGPLTTARSCAEDRAIINAQGAAVLSTSAMTYARYVKDGAYCLVDQFPRRLGSRVPTIRNASSAIAVRTEPTIPTGDRDGRERVADIRRWIR